MAEVPKPSPDPRAQIDKFRDLARELETDDDESRFAEKVKRMAKTLKAEKPTDTPE